MSHQTYFTNGGQPYHIDEEGNASVTVADHCFEVYLTEIDLRLMLRRVERAKSNPSGRPVQSKA